MPEANNPLFDDDVSIFHIIDGEFPKIPAAFILGSVPDIGAVEFKLKE